MTGHNVVVLGPRRRPRRVGMDLWLVATVAALAFEALFFVGMVAAFFLTRAADGAAWPPPGQPWFPPGESAVNAAALLLSGVLVFRAARNWENPEARVAPLLGGAIVLGGFFLFFQAFVWRKLLAGGLDVIATHHGKFFCLIVAMHAVHLLGALAFLGVVWLRLQPLRDDVPSRGPLRGSAFSAARMAWYFAVALWPVLYVCLSA